ncbi:MAG TPA: DUF4388 domain-containing protein [Anaerolineales bacterium]|jgi:hypothetical protein|nr:DUF4388 domain-containing protein [Anaerolineales bacterium]
MALKGNLRDFSVVQIFNLVNLAHKTGTLTLEGPNVAAWVSFREGKLIHAQLGNEDGTLLGVLTKSGKVRPEQSKLIKKNAADKSDKELGLLLINAGYLSQQDILASIQHYVLEVVYRLFSWFDGFFRFDNDVLPPDDHITIRLDLENVIIEGSRRIKEVEALADEIPNLDMAMTFVERPGANIRNVHLNTIEWKVVSYINPKNSIRQIARANKMSDLEIRKIVYALLEAGLVEVVRPEGMPLPSGAQTFRPVDEKQRATLVNRLIDRIRSL